MRFTTDAIVIRRSSFSESSQVAHLLTEREGRTAVLARGSFREKSAFGGPLDLLTRGQADIGQRAKSGLDLLYEFELTHPLRSLRGTLPKWLAASYLLELVLGFSWQKDQERGLFHDVAAALDGLEQATEPAVLELWLAAFAGRLLKRMGFGPGVERCAGCGGDPLRRPPVRFSGLCAGVLCAACADRDRDALPCSRDALHLHQRLVPQAAPGAAVADAAVADTAVAAAVPEPPVIREARMHLEWSAELKLERRLRSAALFDRVLDG